MFAKQGRMAGRAHLTQLNEASLPLLMTRYILGLIFLKKKLYLRGKEIEGIALVI